MPEEAEKYTAKRSNILKILLVILFQVHNQPERKIFITGDNTTNLNYIFLINSCPRNYIMQNFKKIGLLGVEIRFQDSSQTNGYTDKQRIQS